MTDPHITRARLTPAHTSYPLPGMLVYEDRPVRHLPRWVTEPYPPAFTLGYLLAQLYPGSIAN